MIVLNVPSGPHTKLSVLTSIQKSNFALTALQEMPACRCPQEGQARTHYCPEWPELSSTSAVQSDSMGYLQRLDRGLHQEPNFGFQRETESLQLRTLCCQVPWGNSLPVWVKTGMTPLWLTFSETYSPVIWPCEQEMKYHGSFVLHGKLSFEFNFVTKPNELMELVSFHLASSKTGWLPRADFTCSKMDSANENDKKLRRFNKMALENTLSEICFSGVALGMASAKFLNNVIASPWNNNSSEMILRHSISP